MNYVIDPKLCTGCECCKSLCPVSCIEMIINTEGFYYPVKGVGCIKCNRCVKSCPQIKEVKLNPPSLKAYASSSKNFTVWECSSSGGAFTEICKAWDDGNTYFFGASWEGLSVKHTFVNSIDEIGIFRKSKYISSRINDSYKQAEDFLKQGKRVLFSGTPCQIAGLKAYLNKEYDNLLLIDLICHGVGSQSVFDVCIQLIENDLGCKIKSFQFRYKEKYYNQDHIELITTDEGRQILVEDDRFIQLFVNQQCLRSSCIKNCKYRCPQRVGDITIGDFKGLQKVFSRMSGNKKNYSTIVFNNSKGKSIYSYLFESMEMHECDIENIIRYNPVFGRNNPKETRADDFFDDFTCNRINAVKKWTNRTKLYKRTSKRIIYDALPVPVRRIIFCLRNIK